MTPEQVAMMDVWEHVPTNYTRQDVELVDKTGVTFNAQAYIMNSRDYFKYPADAYLEACAKTSMAYFYLEPKVSAKKLDYHKVTYPVLNAVTDKKMGDFATESLEYDQETRTTIFS